MLKIEDRLLYNEQRHSNNTRHALSIVRIFCISEFEVSQLVTMDSVYQTTMVRGANMQQMVQ